jgi:anaerobic glycerol-3-phosphate dehydrogenase
MSTTTKRRERGHAIQSAFALLDARRKLADTTGYAVAETTQRINAARMAQAQFCHEALTYFTSERAASCAGSHKRVTPLGGAQ